jgi:hypothetical protein
VKKNLESVKKNIKDERKNIKNIETKKIPQVNNTLHIYKRATTMDSGLAAATSAAIILIIIACLVLLWHYSPMGWTKFSFKTSDTASWQSTDKSRLRFKKCIFTVTLEDKTTTKSKDVTSILNSMAVAYSDSSSGVDVTKPLKLIKPLNPFSFVITGFNDKTAVQDPSLTPWRVANGATATLTGNYRTI